MDDASADLETLRQELDRLRAEVDASRQRELDIAEANARAVELITDYDEEQQRMRIRMEQTQKLESLGLLAGGIAHDFNNLLQTICGFAQLALLNMPEAEGSPRWEIQQVVETSRHAAELCDQLLSFAGKGRQENEAVDLAALTQRMLPVLRLAVSEGQLELSVPDEPLWVAGDLSQLKQVVLNLVTNASQAQEGRGGTIEVDAGRVHCDAETLNRTVIEEKRLQPGEYVSLQVRDHGAGLEPAALKRIFDPFYSSKPDGRGLGLAVVLGVVRSHGGALLVDSELGQGTSFTVLLPPAAAGSEAPSKPSEPEEAQPGGRVLLVDDDDLVRLTASRLLEAAGYQALLAGSAEEAIDIFEQQLETLDCVILDVTMPQRDGVEVFGVLRALGPQVPVVFASGSSPVEIKHRLERLGLPETPVLQKPYASEALIRFIEHARHK